MFNLTKVINKKINYIFLLLLPLFLLFIENSNGSSDKDNSSTVIQIEAIAAGGKMAVDESSYLSMIRSSNLVNMFISYAYNTSVFSLSFIAFFIFGWIYFLKILFRDYEVKRVTVQLSFSMMFALSCTMFELIIFEIMDIMDRDWRYMCWKFDLFVMLIDLILILPYYQFYLFFSSNASQLKTHLLSSISLCLYLMLFWWIGNPFPILKDTGTVSLQMGVGRIGIIGVTVMALLSGYGAVMSPYLYITYFLKPVKDSTITQLERQLLHSTDKLFSKKRRILLAKKEAWKRNSMTSSTAPGNQQSGLGGAFSWLASFVRWSRQKTDDIYQLEAETKALEDLNRDLFSQLHELKLEKERIKFSKTRLGKFYNWLGYFFSIYCVYKVVMAVLNIVYDRRGGMDPVSRTFDIMLRYLHIEVNVQFWSQHISFIMVGLMTASSVRGFLNQLMKIFHEYSSSITSNNIVLVLAQIMGMYFISSVLLMRTSLHEDYRVIISQILGDIEFNFYHRWFDFLFLASSFFTVPTLIYMSKSSQHLAEE